MPVKLAELRRFQIEGLERLFETAMGIVSFLAEHSDEAYTVGEVSEATGMDRNLVAKAAGMLNVLNVIKTVEVNGRTYFYLRRDIGGAEHARVHIYEDNMEGELKIGEELIKRRRELTEKLQAGTITLGEIEELIHILDMEKAVAMQSGAYGAVMSIIILKALAKVKRDELAKRAVHT